MLYIVTTTGKCNLKCKYCGGSFPKEFVPYNIKYDINKLINILNNDPDATVVYYGGEPLLNGNFIRELNSKIKVKRIGIQTNGTLVTNFDEEFWKPFNFALLSIDGIESLTDKNRGKGVYKKVINSAIYLKSLNKELIARMAVTKDSDVFRDVTHLMNTALFDKIHWQLDVIWDEEWDIIEFSEKNYLPGIEKLMDIFMNNLKNGKVIKIIPIIGILSAHYHKKYEYFPCGAGKYSITINPDGRVLSCPIGISEDWNKLGTIENFNLFNSTYDCEKCDYFGYCGGRCLYAFKERYWGENGFKNVCDLTKRTINIILSRTPEIDELIKNRIIKKEDLFYDPTKDSTEVIP